LTQIFFFTTPKKKITLEKNKEFAEVYARKRLDPQIAKYIGSENPQIATIAEDPQK
jgi:hypothetical protein